MPYYCAAREASEYLQAGPAQHDLMATGRQQEAQRGNKPQAAHLQQGVEIVPDRDRPVLFVQKRRISDACEYIRR